MVLAEEREAVAGASRHLAEEGLVIGTAGNISARNGDLVAVTPTGADLGTVTAEMITVITLDGEIVDGELAPHLQGAAAYRHLRRHQHAGHHTRSRHGVHRPLLHARRLPPLHYSCLSLGGRPVPRPTPRSAPRSWPTMSSRH